MTPEAADDRIRRSWKAGKSAAEIAKRIPGSTRETILDRLRDLGLLLDGTATPVETPLDRASRLAALTRIRKTDNPIGRKGIARRWRQGAPR